MQSQTSLRKDGRYQIVYFQGVPCRISPMDSWRATQAWNNKTMDLLTYDRPWRVEKFHMEYKEQFMVIKRLIDFTVSYFQSTLSVYRNCIKTHVQLWTDTVSESECERSFLACQSPGMSVSHITLKEECDGIERQDYSFSGVTFFLLPLQKNELKQIDKLRKEGHTQCDFTMPVNVMRKGKPSP